MFKNKDNSYFISAKPIRSLDKTWLIETENYFTFISNLQISALLPKHPPHLTGGYWDDISFAGLDSSSQHKFLVLGAGIGSFLPLLNQLNPKASVVCVEINNEVATLGKDINKFLSPNINSNIDWMVKSAEDIDQKIFTNVGDVFIDIYKNDGISEISFSDQIHNKIKLGINQDSLIFINVYDQVWNKVKGSPTSYFVKRLSKYYRSIGVLRRNTQSTIICSINGEDYVQRKISSMMMKLPKEYYEYFSTVVSTLHFPSYILELNEFDFSLLKFENQNSTMSEKPRIGSDFIVNNLTDNVSSEVASLSDFELIKLTRKKSKILNHIE
jgi:SAM-dependent methyltransferase